jgi:excisionase family DNA binding protein
MSDHLTTGEAAEVLGVSRSTVSRLFDAGVLTGATNPVTRQRAISSKSVLDFMKAHGLAVKPALIGRKRIVLGSTVVHLRAAIEQRATQDERLQITTLERGSDVLLACYTHPPDLLVVSDDLPDMSPADLIGSVRRRVKHGNIRILCCVGPHSSGGAREWGADVALPLDPLDSPRLFGEMYRLLGIAVASTTAGEPMEHRRRWLRLALNVPCEIAIYQRSTPQRRIPGDATLSNISRGGAWISNIRLSDSIPARPFRLFLRINTPPLENWQAYCRVLRLESNGSLRAGLQFARLPRACARRLAALESP